MADRADEGVVRLIIQCDDFGMCHAVNQAVAEAFVAGRLTQASMMAPCPWFDEAAALARELAIPVGVHCTLTCEWDHFRWGPITGGRALVEPGGTSHRTVPGLQAALHDAEGRDQALAELLAQVGRVRAGGLTPLYADCHMGLADVGVYEQLCDATGLPFLYRPVRQAVHFDSLAVLSARPAGEKLPWLLDRLEHYGPGLHYLQTHCGQSGPELAGLSRPESAPYPWAEEYRVSDLATVLAPEVGEVIARRDIQLVTVPT